MFSIDGNKLEQGYYFEDQKNGIWKKYHDNGNLWEKTTYKICIIHGPALFFYEDGTLGNEETWEYTLKEGLLKKRKKNTYTDDGDLYMMEIWENGLLLKPKIHKFI